jgi:hypothetical protein
MNMMIEYMRKRGERIGLTGWRSPKPKPRKKTSEKTEQANLYGENCFLPRQENRKHGREKTNTSLMQVYSRGVST